MILPDQKDWAEKVPMVEFTINSSMSGSTGFAPFELTYGYMPRMAQVVFDKGLVTLRGSRVWVSAGMGGGCNLRTCVPAKYPQTPMWRLACIASY